MYERKWVADPLTGNLSTYLFPYTGMSKDAVIVPEPDHGMDRWDFKTGSFIRYVDPLVTMTAAVMNLPVEKRTDALWGTFIGQCLLAIEHGDIESLAFLVWRKFPTEDPDYLNILGGAKQLFNLQEPKT